MRTVFTRATDIARKIKYKNWLVTVTGNIHYTYLQVEFRAPDKSLDGSYDTEWKSRKWLLSEYMLDSEIIQTAFLAIKTAEEHEMREEFKYNDVAIFGPHFDLDKITYLIESGQLKAIHREPPVDVEMQMAGKSLIADSV